MTCIIGLLDKDTIYIGGDSAANRGFYIETRKDSKVFLNNEFIFGFCGSFRLGQILRYQLTPIHPQPGQDTYEYMVTTFVEQVRDCLKQYGFAEVLNERETGGEFLVGFKGRLFCISEEFDIAEVTHNYISIGCGCDIAHGSLYSTKAMKRPRDRIQLALQAAEEWNSQIRKPFVILKLLGE